MTDVCAARERDRWKQYWVYEDFRVASYIYTKPYGFHILHIFSFQTYISRFVWTNVEGNPLQSKCKLQKLKNKYEMWEAKVLQTQESNVPSA